MSKNVPNAVIDLMLDQAQGDKLCVCSAQPATYYEAVDPDAWVLTTAYGLGEAARPSTRNGYVYECTTAGTSAGTEPTWPTTPGNTVVDGTVTWTCRANYSLAQAALTGGDYTKANGDTSGRKQTTGAKTGASIHTSGTAGHVATVKDTGYLLKPVTTCTAQGLTQGGTVDTNAFDHEINQVA